jgi:hypothetical protein
MCARLANYRKRGLIVAHVSGRVAGVFGVYKLHHGKADNKQRNSAKQQAGYGSAKVRVMFAHLFLL